MNALHTLSRTFFFFIILLGLLAAPEIPFAQNQTNDPLVDEQQYLFDVHRIGQAWNYTTGASNVKIGIYSQTGFIQNHEDLSSGRLASPVGSLQDPKVDIASEMAGIVGASTNNGVGMAGIDRAATLQSYSVLTKNRTCDDDPRCQENEDKDEEEPVTFERPDGTQETYYLNLYRFADQINKGRDNGVDVHLVSFGLPSGDAADYALDGPDAPSPFMDLSDRTPEGPNPYEILGGALFTSITDIGEAICGGWFGSCTSPPDPADLFRDEVGFAVARDGGVVVTPAGNLNEDGDLPPPHLPGMFDPYAVTIGGVTLDDSERIVAWNRTRPAPYVDVAAFAENVVGLSGTGSTDYNTDFSSTAASASIGAGVAGLLKAEMSSLTGEDIEEILKRTARDAGDPGEDDATGAGAIDAEAALAFIRTNDIQRSKKTVDNVISDEVVETEVELRGNGFHDYTSTNCYNVKGDLHKFEARVPYLQTFSTDPDAWTHWADSDGLESSGQVDGSYYDPLVKALRVIDADRTGLTVEGYYWTADFYNTIGQRCAKDIPIPKKPSNFEIAYTAVGTEGPPPLEATLSGPSTLESGQTGTWTANVSGGEGSTSYDWAYRQLGSFSWQSKGCSGSDCSHSFYNNSDQVQTGGMRAIVTKGSETDTASTIVSVPPSCGDNVLICPETATAGAQSVAVRSLSAQPAGEATATLTWATTGSLPASAFTVQHRADSTGAWTTLGTVEAADSARTDTSAAPTYRYEATDLKIGTHQFRLAYEPSAEAGDAPAQALGDGEQAGPRTWTSEPVEAQIEMEEAYRLSAYPNPVRERATVELAVQEQQDVTARVYDVLGRRVATLHEGPMPAQETRRLRFNARDAGLSSGSYFVRVRGEDFAATKRLTVVR